MLGGPAPGAPCGGGAYGEVDPATVDGGDEYVG